MRPLELLRGLVLRQAGDQGDWFDATLSQLAGGAAERDLHIALGLAPRRLGKADLAVGPADRRLAEAARPGWRLDGWSVDEAARIAALLAFSEGGGANRGFAEVFKDLRRTSDVAEMIALYRGLPLYPEPERLDFEAGEGLRSNIRAVFEAIAHENPFPRDHFDEHRWNHMVLKALFVGSRLSPIVGLDARANPELARILRDYAHERWAAGRSVTPELWRCVGPFAEDEAALADLTRALEGEGRKGAALALAASPAARAKELIPPNLAEAIRGGGLTWETLEETAP